MTLIRALWCLIAGCCLLSASVHAQSPVQVSSKRVISGAPLLFQSQPDPEISGRHVNFTESSCALSFSAAAVRGLTWSGACSGGRMQGRGTVTGYDDEQQPIFVFEGHIERGLRNSGVMYEVGRKGNALIGWRTAIIGSALQPPTEVPFLEMPRPFLLALDDWSRQTDGKDLLASMGATWAPVRQPAAEPQALGLLSGAVAAAAGGKTAAERRQLALGALAGSSPGGGGGGGTGAASASISSDLVEVTGSMAHCLKVVPAGNDPSVDISTWGEGEPRSRIEKAVVLVNTCPNYLAIHYCYVSGGRNVLSGAIQDKRQGCENLYGASTIQRTGRIPRDQPMGTHPSTRFNFFDRQLILARKSIFVCDARVEQIEVIRKGGVTLAGDRACIKRRGNAFDPGSLDARIIPVQ